MSGHGPPPFRSLLPVLALTVVTLGVFWYVYLYRMLRAADDARGVPFLRRTFWAMLAAGLAMVVAGVVSSAPVFVQGAWPAGGGDALLDDSGHVSAFPHVSGSGAWTTTVYPVFMVVFPLVTAGFLFVELARFWPRVASPVALPLLVIVTIPLAFAPVPWWADAIVALLWLAGWNEMHQGLVAWFDGDLVPEAPAAGAAPD